MTRWGGGGCSVGNQFSLQPVSHLHFISSASSRPINQLCVKYCCVHCSTSTSKWCSLYLGFIKSRHRIWDLTPVKPLFITSFNAVFVVLRLWSCGLCQPSLKRQGYNQGDPVRSEKRYSQFAIYCKVTCWWLVSVNPVHIGWHRCALFIFIVNLSILCWLYSVQRNKPVSAQNVPLEHFV